jgi:RNA polymerase sigma-70 factor (ECF subfamily)
VSAVIPLRVGAPATLAAAADEEAALVERVRAGEAAAFDLLVTRYLPRAFAVAYRVMGQKEDAEDLVQEAFMAVLQRIDRFEAGRPFAPWFMRLLVNRGLNARKARTLRQVDEIPESAAAPGTGPDRHSEQAELRERMATALRGLPERQRLIVEMFELEGFAGPEIAEILEISDGTVRWHLHEARKALRKALANYARSE